MSRPFLRRYWRVAFSVIGDCNGYRVGGGALGVVNGASLTLRRYASSGGKIELRQYQRDAIDAVREYLRGGGGSALAVLPPGTGKSLLLAELIRSMVSSNPEARVMALTHSKELCAQNKQELDRLWPAEERKNEAGEPQHTIGIYSAGLARRDTRAQITFATIQSMHCIDDSEQQDFDAPPSDLIIVDEAQALSRDSNSRYSQFMTRARAQNPDLQLVGLTATPYRLDSGLLTDLFTDPTTKVVSPPLFDKIVFEYKYTQAIEDGWLCDLVSRTTQAAFDVSDVTPSHKKDYRDQDIEKIVNTDNNNERISEELVTQGRSRRLWLVFCSGVAHAQEMARCLQAKGIECEAVWGQMKNSERDRVISSFKNGDIRAITNVGVLTTGFNVPEVDLIALLRPTTSSALYVQMVGRGSRLAEGKASCLVLDFARNIERHGLIEHCTSTTAYETNRAGSQMPIKVCDNCGTYNHIRMKHCKSCHEAFPVAEDSKSNRLDTIASTDPVTASNREVRRFRVRAVYYHSHVRKGKNGRPAWDAIPTLRIDYKCDPVPVTFEGEVNTDNLKPRYFTEWVCVEHKPFSYPHKKATAWWRLRAGSAIPVPNSVAVALRQIEHNRLAEPSTIAVISGKFAEITPEFDGPKKPKRRPTPTSSPRFVPQRSNSRAQTSQILDTPSPEAYLVAQRKAETQLIAQRKAEVYAHKQEKLKRVAKLRQELAAAEAELK